MTQLTCFAASPPPLYDSHFELFLFKNPWLSQEFKGGHPQIKNEIMDSVQRGGRGSNPNCFKCIFGKGEILF